MNNQAKNTGDNVVDVQSIDQELIETVEAEAMAALESYLQEVNAPAYIKTIIANLRLLDSFEGQDYSEFENLGSPYSAESHRNGDLLSVLVPLMEAAYCHKAAASQS